MISGIHSRDALNVVLNFMQLATFLHLKHLKMGWFWNLFKNNDVMRLGVGIMEFHWDAHGIVTVLVFQPRRDDLPLHLKCTIPS